MRFEIKLILHKSLMPRDLGLNCFYINHLCNGIKGLEKKSLRLVEIKFFNLSPLKNLLAQMR